MRHLLSRMLRCDWMVFSLFRCVVPLGVRYRTLLLLLCFLIVGVHASGISIPLSLLMLLG